MTKAEIKEFGADTMHDRSSRSVLEDNFGKIRYRIKKIFTHVTLKILLSVINADERMDLEFTFLLVWVLFWFLFGFFSCLFCFVVVVAVLVFFVV